MAKSNRHKTFPFPYLSEDSTDYKKTTFNLDVNYKPEKGFITFQISYIINNSSLKLLLDEGKLKVAVKIVCPTMGFSKVVTIKRTYNSTVVSYESMRLDGEVEITGYIVSNQDFALNVEDLNDFWASEHPIVEKNNVIGVSNTRVITVTHKKTGSSKSIFQFTQVNSKDDQSPYSVSLVHDDCIVFKLSSKMFKLFNMLKTKDGGKQYIYTVFIIPTISDILRQMINTEYDECGEIINNDFNTKHCNKKWYIVLSDNYVRAFDGKDPTEKNDLEPLEAAQAIVDRFAITNVLATGRKFIKEL